MRGLLLYWSIVLGSLGQIRLLQRMFSFYFFAFLFAVDEQQLFMLFFQNFAVVFWQFSQPEDNMYKIIVWKFIPDKSTSENLGGLALISPSDGALQY